MINLIKKLLGLSHPQASAAPSRVKLAELARRLGKTESELAAIPSNYLAFQIPKRSGGMRTIHAPSPQLKQIQRLILRRLLAKLQAHPCATGFERGHSIVTHALAHVAKDVVVKLDLKDFFTATTSARVEAYFRDLGWDAAAARLLTQLCTHDGRLPQGAPTSPRLSNLLNYRLDSRLSALAASRGVSYSRYADDITFSANEIPAATKAESGHDSPIRMNDLIHAVKSIVDDYGYSLHTDRKLRIARKHNRQIVTGLVVNRKVNLPRKKRRWLRAVEHHIKTGKPATISAEQLQGWQSLRQMIAAQSEGQSRE